MEKTLFECSFYLKDEKGNKTTEYLTTYFETEYSRDAENLLIATFANGNRDRISFSSPQAVRDKETLLKKEMVFVLFEFQLGDENGKTMKTTFNFMFTDIIMARDSHKAEMLLNAKYGQGSPKRILSWTSRTYRYDELSSIPSDYETYEFTFYLKDEKGNKASEMMTMSVDDKSYYKAEEKLIAMLANGNRDRVWHSSGKTIGPSLATVLKKRKEAEERKEHDEREKRRAEQIKTAASFVFGKSASKTSSDSETIKPANYFYKPDEKNTHSVKDKAEPAEKDPELSQKELEEFEAWLEKNKEEAARSEVTDKLNNIKGKAKEEKKNRHPIQNFLVFNICFFSIALILITREIMSNELQILGTAVLCTFLLFLIRRRFNLRLWFPVKLIIFLVICFSIYELVKKRF